MQQDSTPQQKQRQYSFGENAILFYNCVMLLLILLNVISLFLDRFLVGDLGQAFFAVIHLPHVGQYYLQQLHPSVTQIEAYFTGYLIVELLVRWGYAIYVKAHARWFFFPVIRLYEVLAILPELRFLRLIRVALIAYELKQHNIRLWPLWLEQNLKFYAQVIMEWITDQIILTALGQLKNEIQHAEEHHGKIHQLIDDHREQFAQTLAVLLHHEVGQALTLHQSNIVSGVGKVVHQAVAETPQLHQLLKLMPFVGGRIEQLIQEIGQQLGENITAGLVAHFQATGNQQGTHFNHQSQHQVDSTHNFDVIAGHVAQVNLKHNEIDQLLASLIEKSIDLIGEQVQGNRTLAQRHPQSSQAHE